MEGLVARRTNPAKGFLRFAFILLACIFMGFTAGSAVTHAEETTQVVSQNTTTTTTTATADEGQSFLIYFLVFVGL